MRTILKIRIDRITVSPPPADPLAESKLPATLKITHKASNTDQPLKKKSH